MLLVFNLHLTDAVPTLAELSEVILLYLTEDGRPELSVPKAHGARPLHQG